VREIPPDLDHATVEELFNKQPGFLTFRRLPHFTFVEFTDIETSTQALQNLQGYTFRPSYDKPLHIEYDKDTREDTRKRKVEYSDRDKSTSYPSDRDNKRRERDSRESSNSYRDDYSRSRDYRYNDYFYNQQYPPFNAFNTYAPGTSTTSTMPNDCSTLYVTGLPKDITERELSIVFRFMPGFTRVRLITRNEKMPFCFADFSDPGTANYALQTLQGFRVDMRDDFGMHLEFDKNHRPYK